MQIKNSYLENMKSLIESKTFWFGIAQIAFGVAGLVFNFIDNAEGVSLILTGLGSIGFRLGTSKPITSVLPQ